MSNPVLMRANLPAVHSFNALDVLELLRRAVARHGDRPLLVWEPFEGDRMEWTYAAAISEIERAAGELAGLGVKSGDAVILHLENSPESVFAWLACGEIGAVAVTTNARCSGAELAYFADRSSAVGIFTQPAFRSMVEEHLPKIGWSVFREAGAGSPGAPLDREVFPRRAADPAAPFSIQFTSGTTARPKGVLWSHANALWGAMVNARHLGLDRSDVALVFNPMFHAVGQAWQLLASIWVGAAIVI